MKRILSLLLVVLMLVPLAASCKKKDNSNEVTIVENNTFSFVYDKSMLSLKEAQSYQNSIQEQLGFSNVTIGVTVTDDTRVIFGDINCAACLAANSDLRSKDFVCGVFEGKYVVGARSAAMLKKAISYFVENVLPQVDPKKGNLVMTTASNYVSEGSYRINGIRIGGATLGRSAIVIPLDYSVSEWRTAVLLRDHLSKNTGYIPDIVTTGKAPENATSVIYVGTSLCQKAAPTGLYDYAIVGNGTTLEVAANSEYGYQAVQSALSGTVFTTRNKELNIDDTYSVTGDGTKYYTSDPEKLGEIRLMEHNIYGGTVFYSDETGYDTKQRAQMATEVYAVYQPDVLGIQEFHDAVRTFVVPELVALGYKEVPVRSTSSRTVNSTPLFYKEDTLELLDYGYQWYRDIPYENEAYAAIRGTWTAAAIREVTSEDYSKGITWAIFRVKATGKVFVAGSTHLWWMGRDGDKDDPKPDDVCREIQACYAKELLMTKAEAWLAKNSTYGADALPIFFGGDINTAPGYSRGSYTRFITETPSTTEGINTLFHNCNGMPVPTAEKTLDELTITYNTHHAYARFNDDLGIYDSATSVSGTKWQNCIDHIFVNDAARGKYEVKYVGAASDLYPMLTSDHNPIFVDFNLK